MDAAAEKMHVASTGRPFRAEGKTIVFVSHDLEAVRRSCDRVLLVRNGSGEMLGTPEQTLAAYAAARQAAAGAS